MAFLETWEPLWNNIAVLWLKPEAIDTVTGLQPKTQKPWSKQAAIDIATGLYREIIKNFFFDKDWKTDL